MKELLSISILFVFLQFGFSQNYNAGVGSSAGSGIYNTVIGENAGNASMTGSDNTFVGAKAGNANTSGKNNSFFGARCGESNTIGIDNSFFGQAAGFNNTEGKENSFCGYNSGFSNTTGNHNSFFGQNTGDTNTEGDKNSFFGGFTGENNTIGKENSFFGYKSGRYCVDGNLNSFFGHQSGLSTRGSQNCFFGKSSGAVNVTGRYNSFYGRNAGYNNQTGSGNIAIGFNAGPTGANSDLDMRLYIDVNTNSTGNDNPLIYGEFDNDFVRINGTFEVTAGLSNSSSIHLKNIDGHVNNTLLLDQLAALDIYRWAYKERPDEPHIGPTAEDFFAAFETGDDNTKISTIDADGVALASLQALKNENNEFIKSNASLKKENEKMKVILIKINERLTMMESKQ